MNNLKLFLLKDSFVNDQKNVISILAYLCVLYYVTRYGIEILHGNPSFKMGDWLINYEGGFIRRGLVGQALYELNNLGISLLWSAFFLQAGIYFAITHYSLKLFFATEREVSWLLFVFSPAFIFLFPFYDIGAGFRKEIIVFLSFCLLAVGLLRDKVNHKYLLASLVTFLIAVFSHELAVLCLIFFIFLIHEATKNDEKKRAIGWAYIAGFVVVGSTGLLFSLANTGDANQAALICDSLEHAGMKHDLCGGAIQWLGYDTSYGLRQVGGYLFQYSYTYPFLLLLAVLPLFLTDWWKPRLIILLLGFASLLPLYFVAIDWGRWIHIYIFMIFVTLFFDSSTEKITIRKLPLISVLLYASLWGIPHFHATRPLFGIFEVVLNAYSKL